ncbi:hypothetical protein [Microbacterium sp. Marseille-Q6965]|uniref:hypothetical protein n=1 Tax=Microbacterium sp. Marseille-Q6965 TaxID=2965072 RepID=UPI0021B74E58|nr:hypothetical protein [Microbacterium sp. Marseille-Q6965]
MTQIEVDAEAYEAVRAALRTAASDLRATRGRLSSAVPGDAFGPIGAAIPPVLNGLGAIVEGASAAVAAVTDRASSGIGRAVDGFSEVDAQVRHDLDRMAIELG